MDQMRWRLREYLQKRQIPALRLESETGISRVTLYRITSPNPKKQQQRVDFPTLATVIGALRSITGEEVTPNDLLEYVPDPEPLDDETRAWLDAGLAELAKLEPYDWGDEGEPEGQPIRFVPGEGLIIEDDERGNA